MAGLTGTHIAEQTIMCLHSEYGIRHCPKYYTSMGITCPTVAEIMAACPLKANIPVKVNKTGELGIVHYTYYNGYVSIEVKVENNMYTYNTYRWEDVTVYDAEHKELWSCV